MNLMHVVLFSFDRLVTNKTLETASEKKFEKMKSHQREENERECVGDLFMCLVAHASRRASEI